MIVTGANGFIGIHTIRGLLEKGYNIEAVDIKTEGLKEFSNNKRCVIHNMDILDEDFKDLVEMGDKVLHLAAVARFGPAKDNPQLAVRVNVEGTLNIIQACIKKKADRLVYSSTGCFPSDTKVFTDFNFKPIQEIEEGEQVLSHIGKFGKVLKKGERVHNGHICVLKPLGDTEIRCTPNHPFLTVRQGKELWIEADKLKVGDYLVYPKPQFRQKGSVFPLTEDLMFLSGLYLAEGYILNRARGAIYFGFGKHESELIDLCKDLLKRAFNLDAKIRYRETVCELVVYSKFLADMFTSFYFKKPYLGCNKCIPGFLLTSSRSLLAQLIKGYWLGDGCVSKNVLTCASTSETLIRQVKAILAYLGVYGHLYVRKPKPTRFRGRIYQTMPLYSIRVCYTKGRKLASILGFEYQTDAQCGRQTIGEFHDKFVAPIVSMKIESYDGTVYNLETENPNSFTVNGFSVHNSVYSLNAPVPIREDAPREPSSVYGMTKKMAEDWIMFYGNQLPHVILRYGYIYGKGKDWGAIGAFLKRLSNNQRPVVFGGDQTNDFVYVKDVVRANMLALETQYTNQAYNVGTARATSIRDVCEYCIKAMESDLKMKIERARVFDYPIFVYDISKARTLLGFEPEWNVLKGITDMVKEL